MLSFYRYAACPFCNLRLHNLVQKLDEFETHNLKLIAIFQSPKTSLLKHLQERSVPFPGDPPFPILADPRHEIYKLYKIQVSWIGFFKFFKRAEEYKQAEALGIPGSLRNVEGKMNTMPADFLIGPDLTIEHAHYGEDLADHVPIDLVLDWLQRKEITP